MSKLNTATCPYRSQGDSGYTGVVWSRAFLASLFVACLGLAWNSFDAMHPEFFPWAAPFLLGVGLLGALIFGALWWASAITPPALGFPTMPLKDAVRYLADESAWARELSDSDRHADFLEAVQKEWADRFAAHESGFGARGFPVHRNDYIGAVRNEIPKDFRARAHQRR